MYIMSKPNQIIRVMCHGSYENYRARYSQDVLIVQIQLQQQLFNFRHSRHHPNQAHYDPNPLSPIDHV